MFITELKSYNLPAHLVEEAVRLRHPVKFVFVLFQEIHIALLWDKLQQLKGKNKLFTLHM